MYVLKAKVRHVVRVGHGRGRRIHTGSQGEVIYILLFSGSPQIDKITFLIIVGEVLQYLSTTAAVNL